MIGDADFGKKSMAMDKANRMRLARYQAEGVTISWLARKFVKAAGTPTEEMQRRSRGTKWRQVFAYFAFATRSWATIALQNGKAQGEVRRGMAGNSKVPPTPAGGAPQFQSDQTIRTSSKSLPALANSQMPWFRAAGFPFRVSDP